MDQLTILATLQRCARAMRASAPASPDYQRAHLDMTMALNRLADLRDIEAPPAPERKFLTDDELDEVSYEPKLPTEPPGKPSEAGEVVTPDSDERTVEQPGSSPAS